MKIEILLATYNGETFVQEQLDSIAEQSHGDWVLTISDDGSTDRTMEIITCFKKRFRDKVRILTNTSKLGAAENFMNLLAHSKEELVVFCDQDDVWLPHKLITLSELYDQIEFTNSVEPHPVVLYSDAKIVDSKLHELGPSLLTALKVVDRECETFEYLKFRNCFTGCTMMLNREAADLALTVAKRMWVDEGLNVPMHDHWIGLVVAKHSGQIMRCEKSLILYRQHENNTIGVNSSRFSVRIITKKLMNMMHKYRVMRYLDDNTSFINYIFRHIKISIKHKMS